MEFDNLFESRYANRNPKNYNYARYQQNDDENQESYEECRSGVSVYASYVFNRIWTNKKLRLLFIVFTVILLAAIVFIIIALFPLLVKAFNFVTQNGVNGILEKIRGLADTLLKGTGK